MRLQVFGMTDVGRRRPENQDRFVVDGEIGLYAIADGMGGHAAGEVASKIAIEALAETMRENESAEGTPEPDDPRRKLTRAVDEGNRRIFESALAREEWRHMGTTLVALLLIGDDSDQLLIGHIGDSRAYRVRNGNLERLTHDHSWVGEQVKLGLLTDEEASRHPMRNIVTRALGNRMEVEMELNQADVQPGDLFVLCSDGLNSMLTDDEILGALGPMPVDPEVACRTLVDRANASGGEDNITVIVAQAQQGGEA